MYFTIMMFLFDGLFTLVILNWTALFPEMYTSLEDRSIVSMWRQLFGNVGLIIGIALVPMIYGKLGWQTMAIIFGIISRDLFRDFSSSEAKKPRPFRI